MTSTMLLKRKLTELEPSVSSVCKKMKQVTGASKLSGAVVTNGVVERPPYFHTRTANIITGEDGTRRLAPPSPSTEQQCRPSSNYKALEAEDDKVIARLDKAVKMHVNPDSTCEGRTHLELIKTRAEKFVQEKANAAL